jgi:methylmalonyl-CoA mutase N-terminal domain/subunit
VRAVETGYYQEAIGQAAYELQKAQEDGRVAVVGVNKFTSDDPSATIAIPDYSALEARQRASVVAARAARDRSRADVTLQAVAAVASGTGTLMPAILEAVRARATIGEISDTLRQVWGVYRP